MTPGARVAAAIEVLDRILAGEGAERALTGWARASRFAGSKDRAALRDLVYDALRRRRSYAHLGGAETGRGLMIGACVARGADPASVFTGEGYAPPGLTPRERATACEMPRAVRLDLPDWLLPRFEASLGDKADAVATALRDRAPVFLRANICKTDPTRAIAALAEDGIAARPHPLAETALEVTENARRIAQSRAYLDGLVELQDAASQAVVEALPRAARALDYCAGGGGKALALAARGAEVTAHDAAPRRMVDIPSRADRAGAEIACVETPELARCAPFDLVLCDAPCSGSGSWRRDPEGKWRLTAERLDQLRRTQQEILQHAQGLVAAGGALAYVTCSLLREENQDQVRAFLAAHSGWVCDLERAFLPTEGADGFFVAVFTRKLIPA